jgi:hypothetical protein
VDWHQKSEAVNRLFSEIGAAMWQIQSFENALIHYLCIRFKLSRGVGAIQGHAILEQTAKKTLGQLLAELRKHEQGSPGIEKRLTEFLKERNWLVHRIRTENHTDIYREDKFHVLLVRLESLTEDARTLSREFVKLLEDYVVSQGIPRGKIYEDAAETLKQWGGPL